MKKLLFGFLVMLLVILTICSSFTNANMKEKVKEEDREFAVGIPLYRIKGKPGVLIPAFKLESPTDSPSDSP